jgi:hypothetical protein
VRGWAGQDTTGEGAGEEGCVCVHAPRIPRTEQTTKSVQGNGISTR